MKYAVKMPKVGLTMVEGTINEWLKNEGEKVNKGEPLFSVETDKTSVEVEALESGTLTKILVAVGETVPLGTEIAIISDGAAEDAPSASEEKTEGEAVLPQSAESPTSGIRVVLPKVGLTMIEGTINEWLKNEGDFVTKGEPLFAVETDKTSVEVESLTTGVLAKILVKAGDTVPVGEVIALMVNPGEKLEESAEKAGEEKNTAASRAASADGRILSSMRARKVARDNNIDIREIASLIEGTGPDGRIVARDVEKYICENRTRATPLAKILASENGINIAEVQHAGERVRSADVLKAAAPAEAQELVPEKKTTDAGEDRIVKMSGMRKAISRNMVASLSTMAQANHRMKVDMSSVIEWRNTYKAAGIKVSYNDLIIRCCCRALKEMPIMNSSVEGESIRYHSHVNVGIAVSVEGGLIVPVIHDAGTMSVEEIAKHSAELIEKTRSNKLAYEDYHNGTFTISSLGMFDVDEFTAIVNPPEVGILAVGKIDKVPVVENDQIVIRPICVLSLTYDHRVVDGAEAAKFLQLIKKYLMNPMLLI